MKHLVFASVIIFLFSSSVLSTELPMYTTYSDDELALIYKEKYNREMTEWIKLPKEFEDNQTMQVVIPNSELKSYETILVDVGALSRQQCDIRAVEYKKNLSQKLQQYAAIRCLTSSRLNKAPSESGDLYISSFYESDSDVNLIGHGIASAENIRTCNDELRNNKSSNFFREDKKYNFNHEGCLLHTQNIRSLYKKKPIPKRLKKKPTVTGVYDKVNSIALGLTVCRKDFIGKPADFPDYFNDGVMLEDVGIYDGTPGCFKLKKGSYIHTRDRLVRIASTKVYSIVFNLKTDTGPLHVRGLTLIDNVKIIPNNDGSLFRCKRTIQDVIYPFCFSS